MQNYCGGERKKPLSCAIGIFILILFHTDQNDDT